MANVRSDGPTATTPAARRTEQLFRLALVVKGVDGAAELLGAVALVLVSGTGCTGPSRRSSPVTRSARPTAPWPAT